MRGFAYFFAYTIGVSAVITLFIISLMALESSIQQTPSAPIIAVTSNKHLDTAVKHTDVSHKQERTKQKHETARTNHRHETARVIHKRSRDVPTAVEGHEAYGYAVEPRRIDPNLFSIFGQH
jgi:hypothetical protein